MLNLSFLFNRGKSLSHRKSEFLGFPQLNVGWHFPPQVRIIRKLNFLSRISSVNCVSLHCNKAPELYAQFHRLLGIRCSIISEANSWFPFVCFRDTLLKRRSMCIDAYLRLPGIEPMRNKDFSLLIFHKLFLNIDFALCSTFNCCLG